jgi:O-antigen ligase
VALEGFTPAERETSLARLRYHGVDWVRQRLDWGVMEPTPGAYDWSQSDAIIDAITAGGLTPVITLDGSPAWARAAVDADTPLAPPTDVADFARFASAFAARYADRIRYYQVWDEPNISPHWGVRHVEPVGYAQLLKMAANEIRAADPDAVIVSAALAPTQDRGHTALDEGYFLQRLYAAGAQTAMDVVAIQPLGFGYAPEKPAQRREVLDFQRAAWVRRVMQAAGDGETPLWAVRYGWNRVPDSPWGTVTPANQRRYADAALGLAAARWPWLTGMAWAIDRPAAPVDDPAWGFAADDDLLSIMAAASHPAPPPLSPAAHLLALAGLAVVAVLLLWRGWRAGRLLGRLSPTAAWPARYRCAPVWVHVMVWALLLGVYHLAVWPPLILLCWLMAALLMTVQPWVGLWLAAVLLPFHFQHKEITLVNHTLLLPPSQAALGALLPALVIQMGRTTRARRMDWRSWIRQRPPLDWLALAWLAVGLISAWNVWHWPAYARGLIDLALAPLLLYVAARVLVKSEGDARGVARALYIGGALAAILGLIAWLQGDGVLADGVRRLVGPHFSPNHTALYLERTLFLGLGLLLVTRKHSRRWTIINAGVLGLVTLALWLTASRGAWLLGLPAGGAIFLWLAWRSRRATPDKQADSSTRRLAWLAAAALLLLIVAGGALGGLLLFPEMGGRLANSETVVRRFAIWRASLELWRAYPLAGVGPGGFFWRYPAFIPAGAGMDPNLRHPHNLWLEAGTLWGALGLIWLVTALVVVAKSGWRAVKRGGGNRWIYIGLLAGLVAGLAHGQVDAFMALADLTGWAWLALALLAGPQKRMKRG